MDNEMERERKRKGKCNANPSSSSSELGLNMDYQMARRNELEEKGVQRKEKAVLDSKTWANLPEPVFALLFQFLRWDDVFRFQAVRRDWNSFLRSSRFRRSWQKAPDQVPICFASSSTRNSFWNPGTEKWHMSSDDLPPSLSSAQSDIPIDISRNTRGRHFPVVSAVNGYVLIQMYTYEPSPQFGERYLLNHTGMYLMTDEHGLEPVPNNSCQGDEADGYAESHGSKRTVSDPWLDHTELLLIVNPLLPLTKENIKAVPYQQNNYCQHEIVWDPKLFVYELISRFSDVIARHDQEDGSCLWSIVFQRYDFILDQWEKIVTWSTVRFISLENSLIINGKLVCLGRSFTMKTVRAKPYRIYGMELSEFGSIQEMNKRAPVVPFRLDFAVLFYYNGMYMLAGGEVEQALSLCELSSFKVWKKREVFDSDDSWTEVIAMPSDMLQYLNDLRHENEFTCKAEGRFLCIANRKTDVVMCDLAKQSWLRLEKHQFGQDAASEGLALCDPRFDVPLPRSLGKGSGFSVEN